MKKINGSLTIEAAIILPLVLMVFVMAMNGGIRLYQECADTANSIREEAEIDVIRMFYGWKLLGEAVQSE